MISDLESRHIYGSMTTTCPACTGSVETHVIKYTPDYTKIVCEYACRSCGKCFTVELPPAIVTCHKCGAKIHKGDSSAVSTPEIGLDDWYFCDICMASLAEGDKLTKYIKSALSS